MVFRIWSTVDHFHKIITNNSMASYIYISKYSQVLNGQSRESSFENYDIEELYRNENISVYSVVRFVLSSVLCNLILKSVKSSREEVRNSILGYPSLKNKNFGTFLGEIYRINPEILGYPRIPGYPLTTSLFLSLNSFLKNHSSTFKKGYYMWMWKYISVILNRFLIKIPCISLSLFRNGLKIRKKSEWSNLKN